MKSRSPIGNKKADPFTRKENTKIINAGEQIEVLPGSPPISRESYVENDLIEVEKVLMEAKIKNRQTNDDLREAKEKNANKISYFCLVCGIITGAITIVLILKFSFLNITILLISFLTVLWFLGTSVLGFSSKKLLGKTE